MATATKFASSNAVVATGWTSATNAYADDASYATAAPAKSTSITSDYGFAAFTTSDIPDSSIINSVTFEIQYKSSTTGSTGAVIGLQGNNGGSLQGSETTFAMNLADQTVTKQYTSGFALADLRNAGTVLARVRGFRSTSNTAVTWSVDYVKVTVDYSLNTNATLTGSMGDFTLSATGTAPVKGTLSASIGEFTLSATGTAPVVGTLTASIGDFTVDAQGHVVPNETNATLDTSMGEFTLTATATAPVFATMSASMGDFTVTAAGAAPVNAQLSASMGDFTLAATATAPAFGTLSASMGEFTLVAYGGGEASSACCAGRKAMGIGVGLGL